MADEDKTVAEDSTEKESAVKSGKPVMKYLIMAGIVLVMAGAGYFVTLKFVKPLVSGEESAEMSDSESDSGNHDNGADKAEKPEKKNRKNTRKKKERDDGHGSGAEVTSHIFEVSDIIVNPAGTGGTRFLSVSVGFELEYEDALLVFKARQPQIRDALITILGSKNIEQLTDMKQKEIARLQIKRRVEHLLETDELLAVYFTDFVIQ